MPKSVYAMGCRPDQPDSRDRLLTVSLPWFKPLPQRADLRDGMPPIWNQLTTGSCTAQASSAAWWFTKNKQGKENPKDDKHLFIGSKLFQYFNTRVLEDTVEFDSGATIRNSMKALWKWGICDEELWPYIEDKFSARPPKHAYADALDSQTLHYYRIPATANQCMKAIASGYPVCIGISVYESLQSEEVARTGIVPMPKSNESLLGGHAILLCGYDQSTKMILARNSWGLDWGQKGYFWLPMSYIDGQLSQDSWVLSKVE